ncbi:MAG: PH domain-containing protein [Chloroflexi bacterium]|nr:PH domain-containing protein [Chloroflexota bacterium]
MNPDSYPPARRRGIVVHLTLVALLALLSTAAFISLSRAVVGPFFVAYLLGAIVTFVPLPLLVYRTYSLARADYRLGRDSLAIRWGLRVEDIPLSDIEWVRPADDLTRPLGLPFPSLPGAILGLRRHPDIGLVEYIASESKNLLLVATSRRVFAISPLDAQGFMHKFARSVELGSLSPTEAHSVYPTFIMARAWDSPLARYLWLSALFLNLGLLVWVSLLIPTLPQVALEVNAVSGVAETVPSTQLILLPLASALLGVSGWLAGLSFYRWEKQRPLAFVVWISGALSSLAFLIAVLFIISN